MQRTYTIKAAVKNESQSVMVENMVIRMSTSDSSITYLYGLLNLNSLEPGQTALASGSYMVRVDTNLFSGVFNFEFTIYSNTVLYWYDSFTYIVTGVEDESLQPLTFKPYQNYPNPFNPSTKISWQVPVSSHQTIKVFDLLGREIETIVDGYYDAGYHPTLYIVNSSLPSGVYFYQLKAGEHTAVKKMLLLK